MRPIRLATFALLALATVLFAGCYSIHSESTSQPSGIGDVQIKTTACFNNSSSPTPLPDGSSCPGTNTSSGGPTQAALLAAYRISDNVTAPDQFTTTNGASFTFHKDQAYADSLTSVAPPPAGEHWVGYKTDVIVTFTSPNPTHDLAPTFTLNGSGGQPFKGPLQYRTVLGWVNYGGSSTATNDPVVCGADPTTPGPTQANGTSSVCIDSPQGTAWQSDTAVPTRDLALTGTDTTGQQGTSVQIPFSAVYAGAADATAGSFSVSVSSDAPSGVNLTPSVTTFAPATDSTSPLTVTADIPSSTQTGTYHVTLTLKNSQGGTRQATAALTVGLGKPANLALPFISGTDAVGKTVNCSNGQWTSDPTSFTTQWTRDGADIANATGSSYTLGQADGASKLACRVTASNSVGSGSATSGAVFVSQLGGADVDLSGKPSVMPNSDGTYTLDPGITISCPARLPKNCGGGTQVTADTSITSAQAAALKVVAKGGFSAKSGSGQKIVLRLNRAGSKLLKKNHVLLLTAVVTTRNHQLQRVTSRKQFAVKTRR